MTGTIIMFWIMATMIVGTMAWTIVSTIKDMIEDVKEEKTNKTKEN